MTTPKGATHAHCIALIIFTVALQFFFKYLTAIDRRARALHDKGAPKISEICQVQRIFSKVVNRVENLCFDFFTEFQKSHAEFRSSF